MTFTEYTNWLEAFKVRCPLAKAQHLYWRHSNRKLYKALGFRKWDVIKSWVEGEANPLVDDEYVKPLVQYCRKPIEQLALDWQDWLARKLDPTTIHLVPPPREAVIVYGKRKRANWTRPMIRPKQPREHQWNDWLKENRSPLRRWRADNRVALEQLADELSEDGVDTDVLEAWEYSQGRPWHFNGGKAFVRLTARMGRYEEELIDEWECWHNSHPLTVWWWALQGDPLTERKLEVFAAQQIEWWKKIKAL